MMQKKEEELIQMGMLNRYLVEKKYSSGIVRQLYEKILFQQSSK
jgi:hypothetical protein